MSDPREEYDCPMQGVVHELISAMSALNMEPSPIDSPKKNAIYLSETDEMAKHSMEHMNAAMVCARKAVRLLRRVTSAAENVVRKYNDTSGFHPYELSYEELIEELVKLKNKS